MSVRGSILIARFGGCREKASFGFRMKFKGETYLLHWLLKHKYHDPLKSQWLYALIIVKDTYKTNINTKLIQHSTVCFANSKQNEAILTNTQEPQNVKPQYNLQLYSFTNTLTGHQKFIRIRFPLLRQDLSQCSGKLALYRCVINVTSLLSH